MIYVQSAKSGFSYFAKSLTYLFVQNQSSHKAGFRDEVRDPRFEMPQQMDVAASERLEKEQPGQRAESSTGGDTRRSPQEQSGPEEPEEKPDVALNWNWQMSTDVWEMHGEIAAARQSEILEKEQGDFAEQGIQFSKKRPCPLSPWLCKYLSSANASHLSAEETLNQHTISTFLSNEEEITEVRVTFKRSSWVVNFVASEYRSQGYIVNCSFNGTSSSAWRGHTHKKSQEYACILQQNVFARSSCFELVLLSKEEVLGSLYPCFNRTLPIRPVDFSMCMVTPPWGSHLSLMPRWLDYHHHIHGVGRFIAYVPDSYDIKLDTAGCEDGSCDLLRRDAFVKLMKPYLLDNLILVVRINATLLPFNDRRLVFKRRNMGMQIFGINDCINRMTPWTNWLSTTIDFDEFLHAFTSTSLERRSLGREVSLGKVLKNLPRWDYYVHLERQCCLCMPYEASHALPASRHPPPHRGARPKYIGRPSELQGKNCHVHNCKNVRLPMPHGPTAKFHLFEVKNRYGCKEDFQTMHDSLFSRYESVISQQVLRRFST